MDLTSVKRNIKNVGLPKVTADVALRAANRVLVFKILKCVEIDAVNPAFLECDGKYRGLFLDETMLREFSADPKNELTAKFLDEALAKGDECYGFLAGSELAAYNWYSNQPTELDFAGLGVQFDDRSIYLYKALTIEAYRGQRLHAIGTTRALEAYLARGYRSFVSIIEWNNFGSLKSFYRAGYRNFGNITIAGVGTHVVLHHDAGCRERRFRLERIPSETTSPHPGQRTVLSTRSNH